MQSNSESSTSFSPRPNSRRRKTVRNVGVILAAGGALAAGLGIANASRGNDTAGETMAHIAEYAPSPDVRGAALDASDAPIIDARKIELVAELNQRVDGSSADVAGDIIVAQSALDERAIGSAAGAIALAVGATGAAMAVGSNGSSRKQN